MATHQGKQFTQPVYSKVLGQVCHRFRLYYLTKYMVPMYLKIFPETN